MQEFLNDYNISFPYLIDDDPDGTNIQVKPLEEALDLLIVGDKVVHSKYPAIGCGVLH